MEQNCSAVRRYTNIVFDIDGTLMDTEYAILHSLRDTLHTVQGGWAPVQALHFALGIPGEDALKQLGVENIPAVLNLWDRNLEKYRSRIGLFPGIAGLLHRLAREGYGLGVVTSKTRKEFAQDLGGLKITGSFSAVVCADDTKEHKPSPAPLLCYAERAGARPGRLLYVGDSAYDSMCAAAAGCAFALAMWGCHTNGIPADHYLAKPESLLALLGLQENAGR